MENPNTWGPVEKTINTAFVEWDQRDRFVFGLSLEMTIANALRNAGLIKENDGDVSQDSDAIQA